MCIQPQRSTTARALQGYFYRPFIRKRFSAAKSQPALILTVINNTAQTLPRRNRAAYAILIILVIAAGLASRSNLADPLPYFISTYSGDTLWALMVFLIIGLVLPERRTLTIATAALAFSYAIEFSQLYQADWINQIRGNRLAALVLGNGFLWSDLACYSFGVSIGAIGEILDARRKPRP